MPTFFKPILLVAAAGAFVLMLSTVGGTQEYVYASKDEPPVAPTPAEQQTVNQWRAKQVPAATTSTAPVAVTKAATSATAVAPPSSAVASAAAVPAPPPAASSSPSAPEPKPVVVTDPALPTQPDLQDPRGDVFGGKDGKQHGKKGTNN